MLSTRHHSPVNLHRSFTVVVSFSNAKINIIWQKRSEIRAFTPSLVNIYIVWEICSKKNTSFCLGHVAFTNYVSTWKTLISQRSKFIFYLVFAVHQTITLTVSNDFFKMLGYSIIFLLLIAIRARSVTFTSCTPTIAVQRSQSYVTQSYQVVAIGHPERDVRRASHRGSKQQHRSWSQSLFAYASHHVRSFTRWYRKSFQVAIPLTIACSRYTYDGVILHAHPVRGESHNQRNITGEVATIAYFIF